MVQFNIRPAEQDDAATILDLIKQLADYEKMLDEVVATEEQIIDHVFVKKYAEVIIAEENDKPVGFALFFHNFSTFVGKPGIYLEDLFVIPECRGKGYGKKLLIELAKIAQNRNCGRLEWSVLDWNKLAIDFYLKLGAKPMDEWTVYRLNGEALTHLAKT